MGDSRDDWSVSLHCADVSLYALVCLPPQPACSSLGHLQVRFYQTLGLTLRCPGIPDFKVLFLLYPCRYLKVPMGNMGVFDPTEIHNRGQLKSHMKEAMIKLGYHLLCFFIYLYK